MVLDRVLDDQDSHDLMTATVRKLLPVTGIATPYMYHYLVEALFVAGLKEKAVKLLKSYWGKMIALGADPTGRPSIRTSQSTPPPMAAPSSTAIATPGAAPQSI